MKKRNQVLMMVLHIIAWVVYIGLMIKTGAILYSFFVSLFINPEAAKKLYLVLNLSELYNYNIVYYIILMTLITLATGLKALIFHWIVKIFLKLNLINPFSREISHLITKIGYVALGVGLLTVIAEAFARALIEKGLNLPGISQNVEGGGEFLMFAGVIFIIAQIFKRGIEIQSENELTV